MAPKPKKQKIKNQTIFAILAMINIIWYTIVVLIANFHNHIIQSDITIAWFSAWTAELGFLYGIKVTEKPKSLIDKLTDCKNNTSTDNSPYIG